MRQTSPWVESRQKDANGSKGRERTLGSQVNERPPSGVDRKPANDCKGRISDVSGIGR